MLVAEDIAVFQELSLLSHEIGLPDIRRALLKQAAGPWKHSKEREKEIAANSRSEDIIVFTWEKGDGIEAIGLFLWSDNLVYKVKKFSPS